MKSHPLTAVLIWLALLAMFCSPTVVAYAGDSGRLVAIPNPEAPPIIRIPAQFGRSVAAFKTATDDLVIVGGAPAASVGNVDAGAVYLIDGKNGDLIRTIPNPAPASADDFGWSVAVDRDGHIIVGAPRDDDPDGSGPIPEVGNSGAVFVFDSDGNRIHTIPNPFPDTDDRFGEAVAADPYGNIIVGAMRDDDPDGPDGPLPAIVDTGTVFIFGGTTGALLLTIPSVSAKAWDWFGMAVTSLGDRIFVADPYYPGPPSPLGGAIRVFGGGTGTLLNTFSNPYPPDDGSWDQFGSRLAVDELRGEIINGAFTDDDPDGPDGPIPFVANAGSVFVFDAETGEPMLTIQSPGGLIPATKDRLGSAVAMTTSRTVSGAPGDSLDPDGPGGVEALVGAGSVYVFNKGRQLVMTLPNPAPGSGDNFGSSVAVDQYGRIVVGADLDADPDGPDTGLPPAAEAGAAFVFDGTTGELLLRLLDPYRTEVAEFGSSVAVDPYGDIVIGSPGKEIGGVNGGGVFLFQGLTGDLLLMIPNPAPETGDLFGQAVAAAGRQYVVGASLDDDPDGPGPITESPNAGSGFLFRGDVE